MRRINRLHKQTTPDKSLITRIILLKQPRIRRGVARMKTYKNFIMEEQEETKIMEDLMREMPLTDNELQILIEKKSGGKFGRVLKMIAVSLANRLSAQTRKVISATTTDKKLDELAKAISISGGISAIAVAVSDGGKSGVSKIIGLSAIKN